MATPRSARSIGTMSSTTPRERPMSTRSMEGATASAAQVARTWLQSEGPSEMRIRSPGKGNQTQFVRHDPEKGMNTRPPSVTSLDRGLRSPSEDTLVDVNAEPMDKMKEKEDLMLVEFQEGDVENPVNFPKWKKWAITMTGCYLTTIVTAASSSYASGFPSMLRDLHSTPFVAAVGVSVYAFGFGIVPILIAPLSEETGRRPLFLGAAVVLLIAHIIIGAAHNMATVIIGRLLIGCAGSMAAMVGGSIADIWRVHERGVPLAIFSFSAIAGTGIGPVGAGWIETDKRFQWRWIQWFHLVAAGILMVLTIIFMVETRASVLLTHRARKLRKETGDSRFKSLAELEMPNLRTLLYISCTRTPRLLFTEPIVASISGWIGLAWGILFGIITSITPAFKTLHGFTTGQVGTVYLSLVLGALFGLLANFHQEYLYKKNVAVRGPEARLYWPMISALLFPTGMFIFAFTSFKQVPWVAMAIGLTLFMWSTYQIFLASYSYLVDCYGPYASSAIAGQNLFRNLMATAFPLFAAKYFQALTYHWGNALLGLIALMMAPIPFVLFRYGPRIRAASPISISLMADTH